ncbi:transposase [Pseudarthrobacter sp. NPDC058196]|uniref:IS110 family transposase n=1 Tax=Pseudarthrobacter sp. NPDC058196 TaxID=3346376 RepID=UPI0036DAE9A4
MCRCRLPAAGYQAALRFLGTWPAFVSVGIECTGSYGAAVTRVVREAGIEVYEVNRANRFDRRLRGKTDVFDAYSAAEAVLFGRATAAPKGCDGLVESSYGPPGVGYARQDPQHSRPGPPRSTKSRAC